MENMKKQTQKLLLSLLLFGGAMQHMCAAEPKPEPSTTTGYTLLIEEGLAVPVSLAFVEHNLTLKNQCIDLGISTNSELYAKDRVTQEDIELITTLIDEAAKDKRSRADRNQIPSFATALYLEKLPLNKTLQLYTAADFLETVIDPKTPNSHLTNELLSYICDKLCQLVESKNTITLADAAFFEKNNTLKQLVIERLFNTSWICTNTFDSYDADLYPTQEQMRFNPQNRARTLELVLFGRTDVRVCDDGFIQTLKGHRDVITHRRFDNDDPNMIITTSRDGTMKHWRNNLQRSGVSLNQLLEMNFSHVFSILTSGLYQEPLPAHTIIKGITWCGGHPYFQLKERPE